ncbi:hypothetical protein PSTT_03192, partial [Puccinia striiformis]
MKIFSIFVGFMWSKRSKCDTNAPDLVDRSHPGFVYAPGDGNLYLDGKLFNFRNFNAPTIFEGGEYQGRDILKSVAAFGNPVTRTYTLQISNDALQFGKLPASSGHVTGWDKNSNGIQPLSPIFYEIFTLFKVMEYLIHTLSLPMSPRRLDI